MSFLKRKGLFRHTMKTKVLISLNIHWSLFWPKMTWKQLTERGCRESKLSAVNPHDRHTWRSGVRSAMLAASQLSGRGTTDVGVAHVPAR